MAPTQKEEFLKDIQESVEAHVQQRQIYEESGHETQLMIARYEAVEKRLVHSPDDEKLREYIKRRINKWKQLVAEDEQKVRDAEEGIKYFEAARALIDKRSGDLTQ